MSSDEPTARSSAKHSEDERRLDALIHQLPVGVLFRDLQGYCTQNNQKVCDIFGIACNELIGMSAEETVSLIQAVKPDGSPVTSEEIASLAAIRLQRPTDPREVLITTPAGDVRRVSVSAAPVGDGTEPFGSVVVVTDVTESHSLQEQLQQAQRMESIGMLAGGVAHDFNNLLTLILGNMQLALRYQPDARLQERLLEIEKAANRAAVLTRQLLAFSRRQRLERKPLNLNVVINDIMKMLQRVIAEDVEVRVQESLNLYSVFADPAQIEQVVMNLAVNARDAMPEGGQLIIETRNVELDEAYHRHHPYTPPGKYVQLVVSDTGMGMDAETRKRIFEPFFTTKEVGRGTGLGLAMVYGIIKQHEGSIEVYSEPGHGTTFKIYLPVIEKAIEETAHEAPRPLRGGTETILVAEDEESLRALARDILEGLGYTIMLAKDGAEAVEIYEANHRQINLVMLDIVMPRMGGREAYEQMLLLSPEVPAIFMTGYSEEIVQNRFLKQSKLLEVSGAALLLKPYGVETLGRKVREKLDESMPSAGRKYE